MASEQIPIEIRLMMATYSRDMRQATKDASGLDAALASLQRQARKTGAVLDKLGGKISLDLDTSALTRAESIARGFPDIDLDVNADVSRAENNIQALANAAKSIDIGVDIDVNEESAQTQINSLTTPRLEVDVQANEEQVQSDLNSLSAPNLKVDVKADTSSVEKQLEDLKKLAQIELAFTVGGGLLGAAQNIDTLPIIGGVNDLQMALNLLQANTGKVIPDAEKLINDVFSAGNWGATRDEVAGVIGELSKFDTLSDDLGANAVTVFQTMQTTGSSLGDTIDAILKLTSSGLVPDVQGAGDLIVTTFQRGGDVAGDAIDTITEYSSHFAEAGVSGAAAMDLIIQGLQAGTRDGDKLADTFKEMGLKVKEALGGVEIGVDTGSAIEPLRRLGLLDEAQAMEAGEITGAAFIDAVIKAAEEKGSDQDIFDILGTPAEDFGVDILKGLDFAAADVSIIPEGAAEEAATLLNDNLGAAIQNLGRVVETDLLAKIELGGIKIGEILDGATDKVYELAELISSGVGIPAALEIVLEAPGLADTIQGMESALGNFVAELLLGLANVVQGLGGDASGLRATVADIGERQFKFDLQVESDMDSVQFSIEQALRRGVDGAQIGELVARSAAELIEQGDIVRAQELLATVQEIPRAFVEITTSTGLFDTPQTVKIPIEPEIMDDQAAIQAKIDAVVAESGGSLITTDFTLNPVIDTTATEGLLEGVRQDVSKAFQNVSDFLGFGGTPEPIIPTTETTNIAAAALAANDLAGALEATQAAGWPITEEQLALIGDSSNDFYTLQGRLTEYTLGLQDAETQGTAALENLKTQGIDLVIDAQEDVTEGMGAYVLGVQGGLEIAKVSWDDYKTFLENLTLPLPVNGTTPPGGSVKLNAAGGVASPGLNIVGDRGMELISNDTAIAVLNNQSTSALIQGVQMALSGMGGGSRNTTINVNIINNNANAAAGAASTDRLNASLRGFR